MSGNNGDIGVKGNFLKSSKRGTQGFVNLEFQHEASEGDLTINLLNLNAPSGIVNPNPSQLSSAIVSGNLQLFNGAGRDMAKGTDYTVSGTSITLNTAANDGEIFHAYLNNAPQQAQLSLLDGVPLSPKAFLDDGQDVFNIGRSVKIPTGEDAEPILVMRNRTQQVYEEDYTFVDNGSGYSQIIQFSRAGELLPNGDLEFVQVFGNGFIVEKSPVGVNAKLDQFRGRQDRMIELLETNLAIDPKEILLGAPTNEDLKYFGDRVLQLEKIYNTQVYIGTEWQNFTPSFLNEPPHTIRTQFRWKRDGEDLLIKGSIELTGNGPTAAFGLLLAPIVPGNGSFSDDTNGGVSYDYAIATNVGFEASGRYIQFNTGQWIAAVYDNNTGSLITSNLFVNGDQVGFDIRTKVNGWTNFETIAQRLGL